MSAPKDELTVHVQVTSLRDGRAAATADLGGNPLCCYGASAEEAERHLQGAVLRFLAGAVERGQVRLMALRFKMQRA